MFSLLLQAFVCTFSKALHVEYRAKGIIIQVRWTLVGTPKWEPWLAGWWSTIPCNAGCPCEDDLVILLGSPDQDQANCCLYNPSYCWDFCWPPFILMLVEEGNCIWMCLLKDSVRAGDVAQLVECLPSTHRAPSFI